MQTLKSLNYYDVKKLDTEIQPSDVVNVHILHELKSINKLLGVIKWIILAPFIVSFIFVLIKFVL